MSAFSAEFGSIFSAAIGLPEVADAADVQARISNEPSARDATNEYKEKKKLAKRIIKAVQGSLEDAMRKEGELCRKPFEKELRDLDLLLQNSFLSRRDSLANSSAGEINVPDVEEGQRSESGDHPRIRNSSPARDYIPTVPPEENPSDLSTDPSQLHTGFPSSNNQEEPTTTEAVTNIDLFMKSSSSERIHPAHQPTPEDSSATPLTNGVINRGQESTFNEENFEVNQVGEARPPVEPLTPALSSEGDVHPFANGGIPWYMVPFDPVGTTIEEERWTGRDLVRGMSEELSDMDEEELSGLVDVGVPGAHNEAADGASLPDAIAATSKRPKPAAKRKRWRGYR